MHPSYKFILDSGPDFTIQDVKTKILEGLQQYAKEQGLDSEIQPPLIALGKSNRIEMLCTARMFTSSVDKGYELIALERSPIAYTSSLKDEAINVELMITQTRSNYLFMSKQQPLT